MASALRLFSFRDIQVRVHWTFLLLIGWIVFSVLSGGQGFREVLVGIVLVLVVFTCVVLHEFGHALTARHFGVNTRNITLYPIGGVASLERMPEEPKQEFLITLAGPLVNLAIVLLAGTVHLLLAGLRFVEDPFEGGPMLLTLSSFLIVVNAMLFLFNLIPAFPMDGGRILRSLLAMAMPRTRATRIAANIGRLFALGFMAYGLFNGQPFLVLIGVFVLLAASGEARLVSTQAALHGIPASRVMRTLFWRMDAGATVQQAVDELLAGGDKDLIVQDRGAYVGVLHESDLMKALQEGRAQARLSDLRPKAAPPVNPDADIGQVYLQLMQGKWNILPVLDGERLAGIVELENLSEFIQVREATGGAGS